MMRWRIDIEYDGTPFAGWQVQPEQRTVQGCLTEAARQFLGEAVGVEGAGLSLIHISEPTRPY